MAIFEKRPGAPAGSITITTAEGTFLVDDATNTTFTVTDPQAIKDLQDHPFVRLQGGTGGAYVPPPVIKNVFLKDGVLTAADGTTITTGGGGAAGVTTPWAPNTPVQAGEVRIWQNVPYIARRAHTTGSTKPDLTTNWRPAPWGPGFGISSPPVLSRPAQIGNSSGLSAAGPLGLNARVKHYATCEVGAVQVEFLNYGVVQAAPWDTFPANTATITCQFEKNDAAIGTVTTTNASTTLSSPSATSGTFSEGQQISGPGIPAGAVITTIAGNGNLTISQAATASATGVAVTAQTLVPVYFNGNLQGTLPYPGAGPYPLPYGRLLSDPVQLDLNAGDLVWERTFISVPAGAKYVYHDRPDSPQIATPTIIGAGQASAPAFIGRGETMSESAAETDKTGQFGALSTGYSSSGPRMYSATSIRALSPQGALRVPAITVVGDSIAPRLYSWIFGDAIPHVMLGRGGDTMKNWSNVGTKTQLRRRTVDGSSHVCVHIGINDVYAAGTTLTQLQTWVTTIIKVLRRRGARWIAWGTVTPEVTGTFADPSAQGMVGGTGTGDSATSSMNDLRLQFNAWLKTLEGASGGVDYVPDFAALAQAGTTGARQGLWRNVEGTWGAGTAATTDGIHPDFVTGVPLIGPAFDTTAVLIA